MKKCVTFRLSVAGLFVSSSVLCQQAGVPVEPAEPSQPEQSTGGESYSDYPAPASGRGGYGQPGSKGDINSHLPSSSQPTLGGGDDGFDLNRRSRGGSIILRGQGAEETYDAYGAGRAAPGSGQVRSARRKPVPEFHMVKKGDTLWDISDRYYQNPREWPRLWSMNPQVENPHWIYPGDQLRTAPGEDSKHRFREDNSAGEGGFVGRDRAVPPGTVFLRAQGYLGDPDENVWGRLVGANKEVMMLGKGDIVYLMLDDDVEPRIGQRLTVFNDVRTPRRVPGSRKPPGELVKVYGTVRVDAWDPETRMARGMLIESLDVVERGARVGPVGRRFDVVPPEPAEVDLEARILTSVYPNVYFGQHQVVFIDKGSEDGLAPGNRLRAVRRGDKWRRELDDASEHARLRVPLDDPTPAPVEMTPLYGDDEKFPDRVVGEVLLLRTEDYSAVGIVTESTRALEPGEKLIAVEGY